MSRLFVTCLVVLIASVFAADASAYINAGFRSEAEYEKWKRNRKSAGVSTRPDPVRERQEARRLQLIAIRSNFQDVVARRPNDPIV